MRLISFILVAACLCAPASAQLVEEERRRESISVADVRFENPRSVALLRRKISGAVRRVCAPDGVRIDHSVHVRACRIEAQEQAERQLAQLMRQTKLAAVDPR